MRVLVACEFSATVRDAFRKLGHDAWSCDIIPTDANPQYHLQQDVTELLEQEWNMIIAFPPCTHIAVSGSKYFKQKIADGRQQQGIDFFMLFANADCPKIAIENPIGIMSTKFRKPNQIIQPYQFGHAESKKTCLWLKGLPKLEPTKILELPECGHWNNQDKDNQFRLVKDGKVIGWNNPLIAKLRSKTYQGIADAMANAWGGDIRNGEIDGVKSWR